MKLNLESSSYSFELDETDSPATLGRAEDCKCVITEGNVSRKHAEVRYEKNTWSVIDIGSRAGTMVNGKKIEGEKALGDGDVLRLGDQSFVISLTDSNDMEALGARLAGGKVRQLIKTAAAKPKKTEEKKAAPKKEKSEEKAEKPAEGGKPESEKAESEKESGGEGEEAKEAKKPMLRKPAPRKQKSALAGFLTTLLLMAVLGAGGYYGWQYHQQQQQNKAAASTGDGEAAAVKLPPKENAVALPAKETATTVIAPDAAPDATKPPEEKAPEPANKAPDAAPAPDAKAPEAATEAPKAEKPAEAPAADK